MISARSSSVSLPPVMSVWIRPGVTRVHADAVWAELARHRLSQPKHAAFGRLVMWPAEDAAAALRGDRGHADDRARLRLRMCGTTAWLR